MILECGPESDYTILQLLFFEGTSFMNIQYQTSVLYTRPPYSWNSRTRTFHKAYEPPPAKDSLVQRLNSTERLACFLLDQTLFINFNSGNLPAASTGEGPASAYPPQRSLEALRP